MPVKTKKNKRIIATLLGNIFISNPPGDEGIGVCVWCIPVLVFSLPNTESCKGGGRRQFQWDLGWCSQQSWPPVTTITSPRLSSSTPVCAQHLRLVTYTSQEGRITQDYPGLVRTVLCFHIAQKTSGEEKGRTLWILCYMQFYHDIQQIGWTKWLSGHIIISQREQASGIHPNFM